MTKQRKLILDIIMSSDGHMTAEEIFLKAKQLHPSIAVGTVYRNLSLMTEAGEIRRLTMHDSPDRYDRSTIPHEHLICRECGELSDITVSDLKNYLEKKTGMEILAYDLNLIYICNKCKGREANEKV